MGCCCGCRWLLLLLLLLLVLLCVWFGGGQGEQPEVAAVVRLHKRLPAGQFACSPSQSINPAQGQYICDWI